MQKIVRCGAVLIVAVIFHASAGKVSAANYAAVAEIFQAKCVMCHSGPNAPLKLRLNSLEEIIGGSSNGPVVHAGNPENSELVRRIKGISQPRMPMTGPPFLDDREISLIESWVASGLPAAAAALSNPGQENPTAPTGTGAAVTYEDISSILVSRCAKCHAGGGLMGPAPEGYLLTSYQATLSPDERVRVVPGYPATSELVRRITGQSRPRMPYDGPPYLDEQEIGRIVDWIEQGAPTADGQAPPYPAGARIRLQGDLIDVWRLDGGVPLQVSPATRIDKSPGRGDYVEVRGRLAGDGVISAERIRRR